MTKLTGKNWTGEVYFDATTKARGRVSGYAWYFQSKGNLWWIEIAEDPSIEPEELPLVGYGCGGWLYECDDVDLPVNEKIFTNFINIKLLFVFDMFEQNTLKYLSAVSCPCSD